MSTFSILVVDDEPAMLRTLERILQPRYTVATARTLADALARARERRPDLAILDVRMPDADGFRCLAELRELAPDLDVIFMTGAVHELDTQVIRGIRERAFYFVQKPFDRELLLTLVERCAELRRLQAEIGEHVRRLESELEEARAFQRSVMPAEHAELCGWELAARWLPCERLGGDFYDYVEAPGGRFAFLVADVSGHGVTAAMLTSVVKSAFHDAHVEDYEPRAVVRRIASGLRGFPDDRFATALCARASSDGTLEYVNAGHPPAIVAGPDRALELLRGSGPLISPVIGDAGWERRTLRLAPLDRVLAFTDGITDAPGADGRFGEDRVRDVVAASRASAPALLDALLERLHTWGSGTPRDDDWTLLAAVRKNGS